MKGACSLFTASFAHPLVHHHVAVHIIRAEEAYAPNHEFSWFPGFNQANNQQHPSSNLLKKPLAGKAAELYERASSIVLTCYEHEGESTHFRT